MKTLISLGLALCSFNLFAQLNPHDFKTTVGLVLDKKNLKTVCSGVLIQPNVVLTAAHCLTDLEKVRVINDYQITRWQYIGIRGRRTYGIKWLQHPDYNGIASGSVDLGLIFLNRNLNTQLDYYEIAQDVFGDIGQSDELFRVGYGKRPSGNIRNVFKMTYKRLKDDYLIVEDPKGMGGDSGGPVYAYHHDKISIIGLHCGRMLDAHGNLLNLSYLQLLTPNLQLWIDRQVD